MSHSQLVKFRDKKGNTYPYLYIDSKSGIFYARAWDGQTMRSASLETTEFSKARSLVLDKAAALSNTPHDGPRKNLIFKDFYEMMLDEKRVSEINDKTMARIESVWRLSLEEYWSYITPEDITQQTVTDFMTWHKRKRPGRQFYNVFKYLGNIFAVMVESGHLPIQKKPRLEIPKDEAKQHAKQKGRYITDAEILKILAKADKETWLQIAIGYCTGMRKMEIGALELSRLKKVDDRYLINLDTDDTKTGLAREVPLPSFLTKKLDEWVRPSQFLFPMKSDPSRNTYGQLIDKGWVAAKGKAKINGRMRFHDLRHTAASNFAKSNINPIVACTILGMSLSTYQKIYCKLSAKDLIMGVESNADRLSSSAKELPGGQR